MWPEKGNIMNNPFVKCVDLEGRPIWINRFNIASFTVSGNMTAIVMSATVEQNGYVWVKGDVSKMLTGNEDGSQ